MYCTRLFSSVLLSCEEKRQNCFIKETYFERLPLRANPNPNINNDTKRSHGAYSTRVNPCGLFA